MNMGCTRIKRIMSSVSQSNQRCKALIQFSVVSATSYVHSTMETIGRVSKPERKRKQE